MRYCIFVGVLAACEAPSGGGSDTPEPDPEPVIGGEPWAMCVEVSREELADLAAVPEGMVDAPAAVVAANAGDWTGPWTRYGAEGTVGLTATLAFEGGATLVVLEPNEGTNSGTEAYPLGAPSSTGANCAPYYELAGNLTLVSDDGALAESFAVMVTATGAGEVNLGGDLAEEAIAGTARASMEGDWEGVTLSVWLNRFEAGNLEGSMQWSGQGPVDPNPEPTSTGVAFAEPYGSFSLAFVP